MGSEYTEEQMMQSAADELGMDLVDLKGIKIPDRIIKLITKENANKLNAIPLEVTEDEITIAVFDPLDVQIVDDIGLITGKSVISKLASKKDIELALEKYYSINYTKIMQDILNEEDRKCWELLSETLLDRGLNLTT